MVLRRFHLAKCLLRLVLEFCENSSGMPVGAVTQNEFTKTASTSSDAERRSEPSGDGDLSIRNPRHLGRSKSQRKIVNENHTKGLRLLGTSAATVQRQPRTGRGSDARRFLDSVVRSEVNIELNFPPKLRVARSRLYRRRFSQVNTRWKALAEIYTMHSFAPFSNLIFFC